MDRLQLAQHGYDTIAPAIEAGIDEETSDRAERWLGNEVCSVVEELAQSRDFRLSARWSCDHLTAGANCPERRLVEDTDSALVRYSQQLLSALPIDERGRSRGKQDAKDRTSISDLDYATLELIATRPWLDLAFVEDFFQPACELGLLKPDGARTIAFRKRGDLRLPLGDYVSRCMLARVDYWMSILEKSARDALCAPQEKRLSTLDWSRIFEAKATLDDATRHLRLACSSGPAARRREACMSLAQIYVAYAPSPDLSWLGFSRSVAGYSGMIRLNVRRPSVMQIAERTAIGRIKVVQERPASLCDPDVLRQIAASLSNVASLYEVPEDPDELIDWASHRARLVLVDRAQRAVFWDGNAVAEGKWDSHPIEWNLLWTIANNIGAPVDQLMLSSPDRHPIRSRRNRLANLLNDVLDLDGLIESRRRHGYVLTLPREDVILLRDAGSGQLAFEGARAAPA